MFDLFILDPTFWKSSARKIYVVPKDEYENSSDLETRRPSTLQSLTRINDRLDEMQNQLAESVFVPTRGIQTILNSASLVEPMKTAFKCLICQGTSISPVCFSVCCRQLLGCSFCLEQWDELRFPHCRSEDYDKVVVNAFDDLLAKLNDAI